MLEQEARVLREQRLESRNRARVAPGTHRRGTLVAGLTAAGNGDLDAALGEEVGKAAQGLGRVVLIGRRMGAGRVFPTGALRMRAQGQQETKPARSSGEAQTPENRGE